ncbi:unnamed protein product [Cyclocybe aegerita]|uniref:Uncharacterized protein n=1 Tax=Cyclocybe aegerita TaxID=1973307 RepID=A0A8S0WCP0_CYCAE|nr:unnamed protein product [Cyclocybe aegerita]
MTTCSPSSPSASRPYQQPSRTPNDTEPLTACLSPSATTIPSSRPSDTIWRSPDDGGCERGRGPANLASVCPRPPGAIPLVHKLPRTATLRVVWGPACPAAHLVHPTTTPSPSSPSTAPSRHPTPPGAIQQCPWCVNELELQSSGSFGLVFSLPPALFTPPPLPRPPHPLLPSPSNTPRGRPTMPLVHEQPQTSKFGLVFALPPGVTPPPPLALLTLCCGVSPIQHPQGLSNNAPVHEQAQHSQSFCAPPAPSRPSPLPLDFCPQPPPPLAYPKGLHRALMTTKDAEHICSAFAPSTAHI